MNWLYDSIEPVHYLHAHPLSPNECNSLPHMEIIYNWPPVPRVPAASLRSHACLQPVSCPMIQKTVDIVKATNLGVSVGRSVYLLGGNVAMVRWGLPIDSFTTVTVNSFWSCCCLFLGGMTR